MESNSVFFVLRMNRTNKCKSIYLSICLAKGLKCSFNKTEKIFRPSLLQVIVLDELLKKKKFNIT